MTPQEERSVLIEIARNVDEDIKTPQIIKYAKALDKWCVLNVDKSVTSERARQFGITTQELLDAGFQMASNFNDYWIRK